MIMRSALIGLAIAAIAVLVLAMPTSLNDGGGFEQSWLSGFAPQPKENSDKPHDTDSGFLRFQPLSVPGIKVSKIPREREVTAGQEFRVMMTVQNTGEVPLSNLTAEERFETVALDISDPGQATESENMLSWSIAELKPGERWSDSYTASITEIRDNGPMQTTFSVLGEQLKRTASGPRMATTEFRVIDMPETGVRVIRSLLSKTHQ